MKPATSLLANALLAAMIVATAAAANAAADKRIFIVANQADGYGIDQCLANSERCGAPAARAYCQSRDFKTASAYRRIDPEEITGAIPASGGEKCSGSACASNYIAITCER